MLRKLNCFLNIVIGSFIGIFIGYGIYKFWHFKTYPNLYAMQSAPWYTELLLDGAMVVVVVVVCIILKADYLEKVKAITSYLRKEMANMWWSIGGGIIIFALGMFIFLKPGLIWKLTEEWKSYRADEPSEFYLKATKIGGALFALFGIIMIMLPFILE